MKLSFIVPAHNEEKIIGRALRSLSNLPYQNIEVLVGLDGCTDNTESIVKKFTRSKKFKYFNLHSRSGKPEVVDFLIKKSSGDVLIINDADWVFTVRDKKKLEKFLSSLNGSDIGGIAESFPVEWSKTNLQKANFWYKMVAYSHYYWFEFQKEKFTEKMDEETLSLKDPSMFLTNIFKRELYSKNTSLGDDFERTHTIFENNKEIILFDEEDYPRMISVYNHIRLKDFFRQKIRTAIARKQLSSLEKRVPSFYYIKSVIYILVKGFRGGKGLYVSLWVLLTVLATLFSNLYTTNTRSGWNLRAER